MYTLWLTLAMASLSPPTGHAMDPAMCARILGIHERHADKFKVYVDISALTPMHGSFATRGGSTYLHLANPPPKAPHERTYRSLKIDVHYSLDPETRRTLILEEVEFAPQLPPAYAYRLILAHLLTKYPFVTEVEHLIFEAPENGQFKDLLARGIDAEAAIATLPSFDALRAFGFEYQSAYDTTESRDDEEYRGDVQYSFISKKP